MKDTKRYNIMQTIAGGSRVDMFNKPCSTAIESDHHVHAFNLSCLRGVT